VAKREQRNILIVSPEMTPYAKMGGLADVTAALAAHLRERGHDVRVVMPCYGPVRAKYAPGHEGTMCVKMGVGEEWCGVRTLTAAGGVPVFLIEHDLYFGRNGIYHDEAFNDYQDNPRRFGFLCRAALQYCLDRNFSPDIVHANDWQTALVPAYIKTWFWDSPVLGRSASVLTIHNIAYQGVYHGSHYAYLGLGARNWHAGAFEDHGNINFLKGGIAFADAVNTVSPGYAREITTPYGGFGLAPALSAKGARFCGILNGVDYEHWSPQKDPLIPARYDTRSLKGKAVCKQELQRAFGLFEDPARCVLGIVGRFVEQKGFGLVRQVIEGILRDMHAQFVIVGGGDWDLQQFFGTLPARLPGRAGSYIGYNNERAHLVEAGADFFLMPSLFEPCGLNQMYSLKYGTLPIVRATGGLDDTVEQYNESTGEGTGFKFRDPTPQALYYTVGWAVSTFFDRPHHMKKMIVAAMKKDFSWTKAVRRYEALYTQAMAAKLEYDRSSGG